MSQLRLPSLLLAERPWPDMCCASRINRMSFWLLARGWQLTVAAESWVLIYEGCCAYFAWSSLHLFSQSVRVFLPVATRHFGRGFTGCGIGIQSVCNQCLCYPIDTCGFFGFLGWLWALNWWTLPFDLRSFAGCQLFTPTPRTCPSCSTASSLSKFSPAGTLPQLGHGWGRKRNFSLAPGSNMGR